MEIQKNGAKHKHVFYYFFCGWLLETKPCWIQNLCLLRGARESSISSDATHGRVVMAVRSETFQYSKYLLVLKQAMATSVVYSDMELYFTTK